MMTCIIIPCSEQHTCAVRLTILILTLRASIALWAILQWAEIMTGMRPKTYLLRPDNALVIARALVREFTERFLAICGFKGFARKYEKAVEEAAVVVNEVEVNPLMKDAAE